MPTPRRLDWLMYSLLDFQISTDTIDRQEAKPLQFTRGHQSFSIKGNNSLFLNRYPAKTLHLHVRTYLISNLYHELKQFRQENNGTEGRR